MLALSDNVKKEKHNFPKKLAVFALESNIKVPFR